MNNLPERFSPEKYFSGDILKRYCICPKDGCDNVFLMQDGAALEAQWKCLNDGKIKTTAVAFCSLECAFGALDPEGEA